MQVFELTLLLLVVAVALTALARRLGIPYPSLLAVGGIALALLPIETPPQMDPELTLALFLAPVLLDSAFDTSLRDLRRNWIPVTSLVLIAVTVTTIAVAWIVHALVPGIPWGAAIALGAIVAPPDAAAASAVLRQLHLPHRILIVLEGESLLNDASALLIYRLSVLAVGSGTLTFNEIAPALGLAIVGSVIAGYLLSKVTLRLLSGIEDAPSAIVMQFATTFGVWLLADRAGLSAIITVVVYAVSVAQVAPAVQSARQRIPSYAVWETVVFVLNVLAFVLIGLQLRPILWSLEVAERNLYLLVAAAVLATVVIVRLAWVMTYVTAARIKRHYLGGGVWPGTAKLTTEGGLVVGWCGMRGIVTLATAYALPANFPSRDLLVLSAFAVVVGTLVVQGMTLRPVILAAKLSGDDEVEQEIHAGQQRMAQAAIALLDGHDSAEAQLLRREFATLLDGAGDDEAAQNGRTRHDALRAKVVAEQRRVLVEMRDDSTIGDEAFHRLEERLDWAELNARGSN